MRIIYTQETETEGNDCLIKTLYSIIEVFGRYQIMRLTCYDGNWVPTQPLMCLEYAKTEAEAYTRLNELKKRP